MRLSHLIIKLLLSSCLGLGLTVNLANAANLVVIGDSISAAYGINSNQGWVNLLQQRLSVQGYRYQVINASVSGDTTHSGVTRLPPLLEKHQPDIVIIALGGNDGLRGLSLSEMEKNLEQMISSSQDQGSQVILAGIRLPPNYGPAFNQRFSTIYHLLAKNYKIPLVRRLLDKVADRRSMMQVDGIHPTAKAQLQLLDNVWPALKPLLK